MYSNTRASAYPRLRLRKCPGLLPALRAARLAVLNAAATACFCGRPLRRISLMFLEIVRRL